MVYVDDTFLLFNDKVHSSLFINYVNCKHPNIKFTMETESSNSLFFWMSKFLVITISSQRQCIENLHFPALVPVFFSFIPFVFKINAIKSLVFRSYSICSDYFLLHSEFQFLINYFVSIIVFYQD